MSYPTDNPLDARGGEIAAGRAAMPNTDPPATWSVRLPVLISVAASASPDARQAGMRELTQMAREADAARARLAALRLALPELREDLEALVESNTPWPREYLATQPLPADLDTEVLSIATAKKAAHDAVLAAMALAEGR